MLSAPSQLGRQLCNALGPLLLYPMARREAPTLLMCPCHGWPNPMKGPCQWVWGVGAEIDRLVADKDLAQLCPYYVDLQVEGPRLQAIVNKMKSISSTLTLVTTKHGHLHLQVAAEQVPAPNHLLLRVSRTGPLGSPCSSGRDCNLLAVTKPCTSLCREVGSCVESVCRYSWPLRSSP